MTSRRTVLTAALFAGLCPLPEGGDRGRLHAATLPGWRSGLRPYRDEAALADALTRWRTAAEKLGAGRRQAGPGAVPMSAPMNAPMVSMSASPGAAPGATGAAESITNVQVAGVDEGGIVKQAGDFLVILRRGRLFTVRVGADDLRPVALIDAHAPDAVAQGAWYDELLVSESTVVVIGFSYLRGATEVGLFALGADGSLAYRATYHLRSFDYYSTRNFASRLIGRRLVFYTPMLLYAAGPAPLETMPGVRRWLGSTTPAGFERILPATRVYRTDDDFDPAEPLALHTVTVCELRDDATMHCESTAVLGPAGRVFHVSQGSVYVWTAPSARRRFGYPVPPGHPARPLPSAAPRSAVFRLPLDGSAPGALKTAGVPIDQLSFLEDASGHLNVLLREAGPGEAMGGGERSIGALALLRVPLSAFGDGRGAARREHYRRLPAPGGDAVQTPGAQAVQTLGAQAVQTPGGEALQNRFVGDWLLWGAQARDRFSLPSGGAGAAPAWALRYAGDEEPVALYPGHAVERIEAMGTDAVLVGGAGGDLHFTSVRLATAVRPARPGAMLAGRHVRPGASQGESRTHGFFFRATGEDGGLLGLPIIEGGEAGRPGAVAGRPASAAVLFLRQRDLAFSPLGELRAAPSVPRDDACQTSCVDWYGNARPIFLGGRVFALLGYELVEGRLAGAGPQERLLERRRVSFAPRPVGPGGRYSPFD
ncbi:MAG: beta-propeller domain-containing protein [Burkholderiales bacterium]|nr:beta-propeller domain-containing protein [Burkholderiales bacterium]